MKKCSTCGLLYEGDLCPKCVAGFAQKPTDPTAPPEELPLQPGQTFHGLDILELLGRGGMGVVYKARQPTLDRLVALKILPKKLALDPDFQNRFIREAKALGSLSHPNIVAVYDFGAEAGLFFFAMEFVDGVNLRQVLRDRKLVPEQALKIVPQLCDALEYAHGEGVVHRDIKPENIMLDKKGRVKITDFGLAKLVGVESQAMLTMTNMVMGTPHYMAPEQVENPKQVDHRADIYSMGVVFYEMLTGELPIGRFEPPSKKVQVDVRLDEVVLKTLEKQPERRYQKATDVKDAVTRATTAGTAESYQPTVVTPVPAKKGAQRTAYALGAVAVLALAAALIAIFGHPQPTTPPASVTPEADLLGAQLKVVNPAELKRLDLAGGAMVWSLVKGGPGERDGVMPGDIIYQIDGKSVRDPLHLSEELKRRPGGADVELGICRAGGTFRQHMTLGRPATPTGPESGPKDVPVDLTKFFIGTNENPIPVRFADPAGKYLIRNPLYAKDAADNERIVNWLGFQTLTPSDLKQGYLAVWFWKEVVYLALETPAAEQVEREFNDFKGWWNRWSYRKGPLVILVFAERREHRRLLLDVVALARKKLGLPPEDLDAPLENVKLDKSSLPDGWFIRGEPKATETEFSCDVGLTADDRLLHLAAARLPDLAAAQRREAEWAKDPAFASALKVEVLRAGRTVTALVLWRRELYPFERLAQNLREWMGFPKMRFETIVPSASELPDGYSFEAVQTDKAMVLRDLQLQEVQPEDVQRAWRARLKPAGSIVLLEFPDFQKRAKAKYQLNKPEDGRDSAGEADRWVYAVKAPDDPGLDALENLMRAKTGSSPNHPRYVRLMHVRLEEKDLPTGYAIKRTAAPSDRQDRGELDGPQGKISYSMVGYFDLKDLWKDEKEIRKKPDDLVLTKDFLLVHLSGPESAWPVMDQLEATLRKKMRMGPPTVEDLVIAPAELPSGSAYLDRKERGYPKNPSLIREGPVPTPHPSWLSQVEDSRAAVWRAHVDPAELDMTIVELKDPARIPALQATLNNANERGLFCVVYAKGPFLAEVRQFYKKDDAALRALSEVVRAKLRVAK